MLEKINIEGIVENIIFSNEENSYFVFCINSEEYGNIFDSSEIICVGYVPNLKEGEHINITGTVVMHPSYGTQLKIESYEKGAPKTEIGIEKYLSSGVITGIGKKLAERIIKKFGIKTLDIIQNNPEKLSEIKGISMKKALEIGEEFSEQTELRNAMIFLQDYGISPTFAIKIYNHYKHNTIKIIENNPYNLADEIFGIGFKLADEIAQKVGIEKNSEYRIKAGIKFVLNQSSNLQGNVYLPENELIENASKLLEIEKDYIKPCLLNLQMEKQICTEKTENGNIIFLNSYFYAESVVAKKLLELSANTLQYDKVYDDWIEEIQTKKNIKLAEEQKNAIKQCMVNGVTVITGGPGTGKTTTINSIIAMLKYEDFEIELCAPTGRAAKRMTEATGIEAQTIHRLLGISYVNENKKRQTFNKNEDNPIEADVIIVDECSMIDILLMRSLLEAIPAGSRLILVGDVDQLPSVGAGNVLKDIINSGCINVIKLNQIFRQAQKSAIVMNAHRINNGEYPILNEKGSDFFFLKREDIEDLNKTIVELVTERLPKFLNIKDLKEIQILCPMRKSPIGIINLNSILQNALNPPSEEKEEKEFRNITFREGDKVMQIKNNYNMVWKIYENNVLKEQGLGVFNGDEGVIVKINNNLEKIIVLFDDCKLVVYDFSQLDELDLSYAITIHKSQGSEYKAVIMPIHSGAPKLLTRNLLYTAVTRAKQLAVIVGIPKTLYKMIDNNNEINRYTYLKNRIININKFMKN